MVRKKAFGIFGGFLAVMLVFTIISRAVSGAAMARVKTVRISTGTIDHKVSGSGKVEAGKEVAVYTESGQRVKEICVQEGQSVEKGDVLFVLDMDRLEEQILVAQQELEKIKLQDQDAKSNRDSQQENRALAKRRAMEDYNQAVSKGDTDVSNAKAAWDAAEWALQEFLRNNPRPAENVGAAASSRNMRAADVGAEEPIGGIQTASLDGNMGIENINVGQSQEEQESQNPKSQSQERQGQEGQKGSSQNEWSQEGQNLEGQKGQKQEGQEGQNQEGQKGQKQEGQEGQNQEGQKGQKQEGQKGQKQEGQKGQNQEGQEGQRQEAQEGQSQNEQNQEGQEAGGSAAEWDAQKAQLEQAVAEAKSAYEAAVSGRADNLRAASRAIEDANASVPTDSTAAQNEIARKQQELSLGKLQDLQKAEGKITAPVGGLVTQIAVTTGDFTTEGTAVRLADTSQRNRLVASIDKSNEEYVQKGSPVTISPSGSKDRITDFTVSNVSENKEDNTLLDVAIDLPKGVLEAGASAQIEIIQKSRQFSSVIPIQALREEQAGYSVLVLREQQGVMGTELVVEKMEVQVLDKNSTNAALEEGFLTGDQEIISASSRSIEDGSRVRREE